MQLIRAAIADQLEQVNQLIIEQLHSDVPLVENVGQYIVEAGGKRLRPLLVLLSGAALTECNRAHITFAAIIEFIHTATLLHDDVVDISSLRRGRPTANAAFGNAPSVLVGDFLYTRAFQLMVGLENNLILRHMADTTNTIAEGEVLQLSRAGNAGITEQQYLDVITRKTAVLFGAACHGAAVLSGQSSATQTAMREFGLNLGIAFQIIDDVLDYEGDPAAMGKNIGDDLTEGKSTLPIIFALRTGTDVERQLLRRAITEQTASEIDDVIAAIRRCGALDYARDVARGYHDQALIALQQLPSSSSRALLEKLTAMSLDRES